MSKKGFTLVELLTVIAILAVITLMSTPIILNVLENSKKNSAFRSAEGYMKAYNNYSSLRNIENTPINDGTYIIGSELLNNVTYSGTGPTNGEVVIANQKVDYARFCINDYSVDYTNNRASISSNDYCGKNLKLKIYSGIDDEVGNEISLDSSEYSLDLSDKTEYTSVMCNNGTKLNIEGNNLKISSIYGTTTCTFVNGISNNIENLDETSNYVILLKDDDLNKLIEIKNDLEIDINGKILTTTNSFQLRSNLVINDSTKNGEIKVNARLVNLLDNAKVRIKYAKVTQTNSSLTDSAIFWISSGCVNKCSLVVDDADIDVVGLIFGFNSTSKNSNVTIYDGVYNSKNSITSLAYASSNTFNIEGGTYHSLSNYPVILNNGLGTMNIKNAYVSNTYYEEGDWHQIGIRNNNAGIINIENTKVDSVSLAVYNNTNGTINIKSGEYKNNLQGYQNAPDLFFNASIYNNAVGVINICSATIDGTMHLRQANQSTEPTGHISYKSTGINWINSEEPIVSGSKDFYIEDDSITCNQNY